MPKTSRGVRYGEGVYHKDGIGKGGCEKCFEMLHFDAFYALLNKI